MTITLTEKQREAVESWNESTAMIAGAGSGKTEVLTRRLLAVLESGKAGLHQILAITFTEKAAYDLKRRVAEKMNPEQREEIPWAAIGTFHAFCLELIREHAPLLGLADNPGVWDEPTAKLAIHKVCRQALLKLLEEKDRDTLLAVQELDFKNILALLEELLHFRWHTESLWDLSSGGAREKALMEAAQSLYRRCAAAYAEEKNRRRALDFQDLEILALRLLEKEKEIRNRMVSRFAYLFVDEAQDLNDLQKKILSLLFNPGKNTLCLVGDPKQSIYRFRGANVAGFDEWVRQITRTGGRRVALNENFRSRPRILDFVNRLFGELMGVQTYAPLEATRGEDPESLALLPVAASGGSARENREAEAEAIAAWIAREIRAGKRKCGDFALLFQTLKESRFYTQALQRAGIPYRLHGGRGFLEAQEVLDLLFILRLMNDLKDRLSLVGLMRSPLVGLSDAEIFRMTRDKRPLEELFLEREEAAWFIPLWEERSVKSGSEILTQAVEATHLAPLLFLLDPSGTKLANVEQLIEWTREMERNEEMTLPELIETFDELIRRKTPIAQAPASDIASDACQLLTVHTAKGLEYPVVLLPDLSRGEKPANLPYEFSREAGLGLSLRESGSPVGLFTATERGEAIKQREKELETREKMRLLYVAMTRAREQLVLPRHETVKREGRWAQWIGKGLASWPEPFFLEAPPPPEGEPLLEIPERLAIPALEIPRWERGKHHWSITELKGKQAGIPEKVWRLPAGGRRRGLKGPLLGDIVHAFLKNWRGGEQNADAVLTRGLVGLEIVLTPEERKEALALIRKFLEGEAAPPTWEGKHELPFKMRWKNGMILSGVMDYVYDDPGGGRVICDFKTDAKPNPKKYALQMNAYALALSLAGNRPVLETRLIFIRNGQTVIRPWTAARARQAEKELDRALANMLT